MRAQNNHQFYGSEVEQKVSLKADKDYYVRAKEISSVRAYTNYIYIFLLKFEKLFFLQKKFLSTFFYLLNLTVTCAALLIFCFEARNGADNLLLESAKVKFKSQIKRELLFPKTHNCRKFR